MTLIKQDWVPLFEEFIKYIRINSKEVPAIDKLGAPLNLWPSQQMALDTVVNGMGHGIHTFMFGKARQQGISTFFETLVLFWLATHNSMMGAYVIDKEKNLPAIRDKIKRYFQSFPTGFFGKKFQIENDNKEFMTFSNGSRLDFLTAGVGKKETNWGEGKGYALVHACMAKGTPVVLEHGRIKPIEDVRIGDRVITHNGHIAKIVDAVGQPNTKGAMVKISPWLGHPVLCTQEHKFPTQRGLVRADRLLKSDFLIMPVRKITNNPPTIIISSAREERGNNQGPKGAASEKTITIDSEIGFAIGYYLAEGCMIHNSYDGRPCGISFARHRSEKSYADRAIKALCSFTTGSRKTHDRKDCLTSTDTIYGTPLCQWIEKTFGSRDKKIIPDNIFSWGDDFCEGLLTGILCGDGSKNSSLANKKYKLNRIVMPSIHSSLAMQTRDIAASLGYGWGSVQFIPAGNHYGRMCKPCWRITWNGSAAHGLRSLMGGTPMKRAGKDYIQKYKISEDKIYLKIKKIEYGFEEDTMWDLSVDHKDHTFRTPYMSTSNTEVAKYGNADGLSSFRSTLAETNPDRLFIYESTSKGMNHWKEMWSEFGRDEFRKRRLFIGWWGNPNNKIKKDNRAWKVYGVADLDPVEQELIDKVKEDYGYEITREQLAWYRQEHAVETTSIEAIHQNLPWTIEQSFVATGHSFFQMPLLEIEMDRCSQTEYTGYRYAMGNDFWSVVCEPIYDANRIGEVTLRIWEPPDPNGTYAIGCDPAYGRSAESDRHAISVVRCFGDRVMQVAEYADNEIDTRQCTWVLAHLAGAYKNCLINVESAPGPGGVIMNELENLRERMRIDPKFEQNNKSNENWSDFLEQARWYLYKKPDHWGPGSVKGWESTFRTKSQIMNQLRDNFVTQKIIINSKPLVEEMMDVIRDGDSIEAPAPAKDDRVIALALAVRGWMDSLMMGLLTNGETYETYIKERNGEPVDKKTKMINNIVRDFFRTAEEKAEMPKTHPREQWLLDRGYI